MEQERNSAYRALRVTAYRKKYETALYYGGKSMTYGILLNRVEYAYNTFCQMGIAAQPQEEPVDHLLILAVGLFKISHDDSSFHSFQARFQPLDTGENKTLQQKSPVRKLHRRLKIKQTSPERQLPPS